MPNWSQQANRLRETLSLHHEPVAVTFTNEPSKDLSGPSTTAPAGCSFWEMATESTFAASTADHGLCSIGIHTHNLSGASESVQQDLKDTLGVMAQMDYVRDEDVVRLPVLDEPHSHVVYGPLKDSTSPDAVVLFTDGRQSLLLSEAVDRVETQAAPAMGRPACAAIPGTVNSGKAVMSLGCCGARAYNDLLTDDRAMWVLPGKSLEAYSDALEVFRKANNTLQKFHVIRRKDVEEGGTPTIKESLGRLA